MEDKMRTVTTVAELEAGELFIDPNDGAIMLVVDDVDAGRLHNAMCIYDPKGKDTCNYYSDLGYSSDQTLRVLDINMKDVFNSVGDNLKWNDL